MSYRFTIRRDFFIFFGSHVARSPLAELNVGHMQRSTCGECLRQLFLHLIQHERVATCLGNCAEKLRFSIKYCFVPKVFSKVCPLCLFGSFTDDKLIGSAYKVPIFATLKHRPRLRHAERYASTSLIISS